MSVTLVGPALILGGLPVIAKVTYGMDSFTGEGWAEVQEIYWRRYVKGENGQKRLVRGKRIPQNVWDRAEAYDSYFSEVTEAVSEYNALSKRNVELDESTGAAVYLPDDNRITCIKVTEGDGLVDD